ncbi:MAG: winged helix-turn-helix domain-containing protein [DPANN group archaeon]|nr:winged helix-turn-helix domain-containing protein [DPANN group archaeon]
MPYPDLFDEAGELLSFRALHDKEFDTKNTVLLPAGIYLVQRGLLLDYIPPRWSDNEADLDESEESKLVLPPLVLETPTFAYGKNDLIFIGEGYAMEASALIPPKDKRPRAKGKVEIIHHLKAKNETVLSYISLETIDALIEADQRGESLEKPHGRLFTELLAGYAQQTQATEDWATTKNYLYRKKNLPIENRLNTPPEQRMTISEKRVLRLQHVFRHLAERSGEIRGEYTIFPISQTELGGLMGYRRETVSRIMHQEGVKDAVYATQYQDNIDGAKRPAIAVKTAYLTELSPRKVIMDRISG